MFGSRRRRGSSNPPLNASNANPNAATAAAQAFLNNQASNASLASAAAGAALRSRPTTPTSVADVQTKRMLRRAGSTSSVGSSTTGSVRGPPGASLERRGSNSSMSERTFRDPSPARHVPSAVDAPPVPALPKNISLSKAHRRPASMEVLSNRIASPPPSLVNGRGSSLGPSPTTTPKRAGQRTSGYSSIPEQGLQRPDSRGSVNYSLPTCTRAESPVDQRQLTSPSPNRSQQHRILSPTKQNLVYDPNTRSFLPYAEILAIEQRIQNAAYQPVKKKKRVAQGQLTGTHLAEGTMGRPHGTAVDAIEATNHSVNPVEQPTTILAKEPLLEVVPKSEQEIRTTPPAPTSTTPKKKRKKKMINVSDSESDQGSYMPNSSDNDSDFRTYSTRTGTMLAKKPSIVREDREREEKEDDTLQNKIFSPKPDVETRISSPPLLPRSAAGRGKGRGSSPAPVAIVEEHPQAASVIQADPEPVAKIEEPVANVEVGKEPVAGPSAREARVQSVSPARTTHFATTPDNLMVKHQPPGRSISPRKSALKQSSLERNSSPGGDLSGNDMQNGSVVSDDSPMSRKKAVRVSFDDSSVVVGEAAGSVATDSPIAPSPQVAKRNWFSLSSRARKKGTAVEEEDDEVMKPRPALPSFGSVRGRNIREPVEERQLVKPTTESSAPAEQATFLPSPPLVTNPTGEEMEYSIGQSNDHVVGAILLQDAASKNEANTSKSREPLPPQVTSVEGSGYHSDTDSTISALDDTYQNEKTDIIPIAPSSESPNDKMLSKSPTIPTLTNSKVPEISLTQATPTIEISEWLSMPGGFPEESSDAESIIEVKSASPPIADHHVTDLTPSLIGIAEPYEGPQPGSPVLGDVHTALESSLSHAATHEDTEDSDTTSIYSDAAEDLSDLEDGDGFQSLNAIVENPIAVASIPRFPTNTPPESPTIKAAKERAYKNSQLSKNTSEPDLDAGWGKAQEYWSGLSAEKKRQLEQEACDEEEDSESTIEAKAPLPKPKTKKAAVVAAPVQLIEKPQPYKHERTYMIQPGTKVGKEGYTSAMKSSMRGESSPIADTHIRKSMRSQGAMYGSLRGAEKVEPRAKQRPVSLQPTEIRADPAAVKIHVRALSAANASAAAKRDAAATPTLRRRGSGDSDSSFKRAKPAEVTAFRRSMRNSSDQPRGGRQQSPLGGSRFSLRSMSPSGSTVGRGSSSNPPAPMGQTQMRSSLRNSQTPSLRNRGERIKSPRSIPGFGRSQPSKPVKSVPNRSSRFDDSSDEEEARPAFQSRFVDSSDEDDGLPPLPKQNGMRNSMRANQPVRSIPRRAGVDDGDSSDLPDSDDEKTPISPSIKLSKMRQNGTTNVGSTSIRRSGSGRGAVAPITTVTNISGPVRPTQSRRGSFMNILRRKKADPSSKVRKSEAESPARRDTPLERSKSDLMAVKRQESYNSTNGVTSPKLQKRSNSNSWPLPGAPIDDEKVTDDRPLTADAADGIVGGEIRPDLGTRRSTATGLGIVDINGPVGTTPPRKKKKFQALRKMFRLDD